MHLVVTSDQLGAVLGGGFRSLGGAFSGAVKAGYSVELPPGPGANDLKLMERRGFKDPLSDKTQLEYQRYRLIMQGVSGHPIGFIE